MKNVKLHIPKKNTAGKTYCGPTVLSALSGKSYSDVLGIIETVINNDSSREIKWMNFYDLHSCILQMGFKAEVEILDDDCATDDLCTLEKWIDGRDYLGEEMGDDPKNDTWIIQLTSHFIIIQGDMYLDNHTGVPVPFSCAPFKKKRVRKAIKIESNPREMK